MREVTKMVGKSRGRTSVLLAGVHGNEPCGLQAFEELLPVLKIDAGEVFFVVGNPNAVASNVRQTEFNLNRAFKPDNLLSDFERSSYEYHRAQYLKRYLDQAWALLDIHSSFTPKSIPFVICEENAYGIASHFPVELVVSGFDRHQPGGTDYYMNATGKIGMCIECGYHTDPRAKIIATEAILSFLGSRGHIAPTPRLLPVDKQRRVEVHTLYHTKVDFKLAKAWSDFETVPPVSIIGTDGTHELVAERDMIILFARNCNGAGEEAFLLGKTI
jgi:succinylglutamate desuccinylase